MRTASILAFVVLTGTTGEIALTHAMKRIGEMHRFSPAAIARFVLRAMGDGWLWISIGLMAISFYAFLTMLSWYPVSFVVPATSLAYVAGAFGAKFLLGEHLSATRWTGVALICLGVSLAWINGTPSIPHVSGAWLIARYVVFACALASLAFYVLTGIAAWRFFRAARTAARPSDVSRPVSILKPVRGLDDGAYDNFASFCNQDYPEYEILFAVTDEDDPAIPIIHRLMHDFPDLSIRLFVGREVRGTNDKVAKLCRLVGEARYELLAISDSDVRVAPDYLRGIAAPFADARVGAVTALYRAARARSFGAVLDAVGSAVSFTGSVLLARMLEGVKFAMGSTMAARRSTLAEIGGLEPLLDLHSDDYEFGRRIAERGYLVEVAPRPVDIGFPSETLADHLRHELRWLVGIRHIRPGGHAGMLMTHGLAWAIAAALLSGSGTAAAAWLGAYFVLRIASGYIVAVWGLSDRVARRWLWLLPLRDALFFGTWVASFLVNRIEWRGLSFTLEEGRMVPIAPTSPDRN